MNYHEMIARGFTGEPYSMFFHVWPWIGLGAAIVLLSGGENGVCNYPMGMEVGVITEPEDAYWNWAYVELANNYDGFSFSGTGGKEDHPKLQRTKSNPSGDTDYGTQIIFRLKYDNRKKSEIFVNHN